MILATALLTLRAAAKAVRINGRRIALRSMLRVIDESTTDVSFQVLNNGKASSVYQIKIQDEAITIVQSADFEFVFGDFSLSEDVGILHCDDLTEKKLTLLLLRAVAESSCCGSC
jgi:hypothetical protein